MIFTVLNIFVRFAQVAMIAGLAVYFVKAEPVSVKEMAAKWRELNE